MTSAIEVKMFTTLERFYEAGEDHDVLRDRRATLGAVPKVPYPKSIPPEPPNKVVDPITIVLSIHC